MHGRPWVSPAFIGSALWAGTTAALFQAQVFLQDRGWLDTAEAATDLTLDTFYGLFTFVVPGSDVYSISQGVSTVDAGGMDAGAIDVLIATVERIDSLRSELFRFGPADRSQPPWVRELAQSTLSGTTQDHEDRAIKPYACFCCTAYVCLWALCHEYRWSKRRCATVREMKEGPSRSAIRC